MTLNTQMDYTLAENITVSYILLINYIVVKIYKAVPTHNNKNEY